MTTRSFRYLCSRCSSACTSKRCGRRRETGRLPVTYDTRTTFRRLRARATPAAARAFRRVVLWAIGGAGGPSCAIDVGQCARRLRRADSRATSRTRVESGAIGHAGGRSAEGRRLSMGGAETHAVARVLATNHRTPPVSWAQATSGDDHRPLGGGTNAGRELERQPGFARVSGTASWILWTGPAPILSASRRSARAPRISHRPPARAEVTASGAGRLCDEESFVGSAGPRVYKGAIRGRQNGNPG